MNLQDKKITLYHRNMKQTKKTSDYDHSVVAHEKERVEQQVEEWKTKYMRALADYQNLEKRSAERVNEVRQYAGEIILSRLLPVVDTFSKVKEHIKDPGMDLAYKELLSVLASQGVERMDVVGKPFDPTDMDCTEVVDGKVNEVVEEVMPGYRLHGKVLRVARVKVGGVAPKNN